jgi:streptogramin lyase
MAWLHQCLFARYSARSAAPARRVLRVSLAVAAALATVPLAAPAFAAAGPGTKFPLPAADAFPTSIVTGADGNLWFVESGKIGRISTAGRLLNEYALPAGHNAKSIAPGPSNTLWFTEPSNGRVGRISAAGTTTGKIDEFLLAGNSTYGTPINQPQQIVAGPDGQMWFTQTIFSRSLARPVGGKIDSVDAAGNIQVRVTLPTGSTKATTAVPDPIVLGPGGTVWFADIRLARVEKVTTGGDLSIVTSLSAGSPAAMAFGPEGNLWLTANYSAPSGSLLYRIGQQGQVLRTTSVPPDSTTNGNSVGAIAAGPDGNMWFTSYDLFSSRGSVFGASVNDPNAALVRVRFSQSQEIDSLTTGPDHGLWYTTTDNSTGQSAIGRLATS